MLKKSSGKGEVYMLFNKKGFLLAEVMVVASITAAVLIVIYTQFNTIYDSYEKRQKYESVDNLYVVKDVADLVKEESLNYFKVLLESAETTSPTAPYIDITDCTYFTSADYCEAYITKANIKKIIFTKYDTESLTNFSTYQNDFSPELKEYITYINSNLPATVKESNRIIIEFNDYTYSNLGVEE